MGLALLTPPAAEPLTLAEARAWLRLETDEDDALVLALVTAARLAIEARTGRKLPAQTWRWTLDAWPAEPVLALPVSPVAAVASVRVSAGGDAWTAVPTGSLLLDTNADPARLGLLGALPIPGRALGGIAIDLQCGFAVLPGGIPEPLRQAVRLVLAFLYENRGETGGALAMPDAAAALAEPWRARRLR